MKRSNLPSGLPLVLMLMTFGLALPSCRAEPNPEIVSRLEQILEIREFQLEQESLIEELGRSDFKRMGIIQIATLDARIALAEEREQLDSVISHLEEKIQVYESLIQKLEAESEEGLRPLENIAPHRIALLETEIRLLRLRGG